MGSRDLLSQLSRLGELGQIALAQFLEVRQRRHDEISECTDARDGCRDNVDVVVDANDDGWRTTT